MKLEIVHISPTYFKDLIGGGERYPWELSKALSKYTNTSLIVFGNERVTERISDTLIIEKYPAVISPTPLFTKTNPFPLRGSFLNKIDEADVVHIHQFNTLISNLLICYARYRGKVVCVTDHGGGYFKLARLMPTIGKMVDSYMLVSNSSAPFYRKYNRRLDLICGGVDEHLFSPVDIEKKHILFVGKILRVKGIDTLIRAVQGLDIPLKIDARLLDQNYLYQLINIDKNHSTVFNFDINDVNLVRDYNQSLVTILPSLSEMFPLVILESLACGTPVICTDVGGVRQIIEHGKNGFIVPPKDQNKIKEFIQYFVDNPSESKKMGDYGRRLILKRYTWDAVANRCLRCYHDLVGANIYGQEH